jgi:O-antigen/teichoic acid export membrane protein
VNAGDRRGRGAASAIPLLGGLVIQAITTYAVLVIAGRSLGASGFGALSGLYVLITSIATGLFLPLEQEVARRRGDERGRQVSDDSLLVRAITLALIAAGGAVVIVLAALPLSLRLLGHDPQLVAALCVALPGYALCFTSRGEFAGRRQLVRYGVQLGVEGVSRLVGALILVVLDVHSPGWFGWLFAAAPWLAYLVSVLGWKRPPQGEAVRGPGLARPVGLLVVSCLASQLLINAGPLVVAVLARASDRAHVGVFLAALVIVRLPVFLFTAVQPSFLPAMAEHAAADRRDSFVRLVRRVLLASSALVVLSTAAAVAIGPWGLHLLFGFRYALSRWTFFEMTLAVGLFLISAILAQSLLGRGEHAATTAGWLAGLAGLAAGTALGHDAVARAGSGFLVGALVATAVLGCLLLRALKRWQSQPVQVAGVPG